jgi:hypothetical protein
MILTPVVRNRYATTQMGPSMQTVSPGSLLAWRDAKGAGKAFGQFVGQPDPDPDLVPDTQQRTGSRTIERAPIGRVLRSR